MVNYFNDIFQNRNLLKWENISESKFVKMGKGDGCCGTREGGYAMDWRENSHDMDELVVKIMQQGEKHQNYATR